MLFTSFVLSAFLAGCNAALLPSYVKGYVEWKDCPGFLKPNASSPLRCGYLDVPLDWDNPDQHEPVKIGFVKIPARNRQVRAVAGRVNTPNCPSGRDLPVKDDVLLTVIEPHRQPLLQSRWTW